MAWMDGKLDKMQNSRTCKCGAKSENGVYVENELIGEYCNKCYAEYLLNYMSCVDYIRGYLNAKNGTREQAAELAAKFANVDIRVARYAAAQHRLHSDAGHSPAESGASSADNHTAPGASSNPAPRQ